MAAFKLIILLMLPACVFSTMAVIINVDKNQTVYVSLLGSSDEYLTDKDRELFQIRDHELNQSIYLLTDALPNYVEVGHPYSNHMHSGFSWNIVRRKVVPIEYKIKKKETRELVAGPVLYPACDYHPFSNNDLMISSQWQPGQYMSNETIFYYFVLDQGNQDLNFKHKNASYTGEFGKRLEWNSGVKIGSGIRSDISFYGKEAAMHVKEMVLEIEIKYQLSVHGAVACSYPEAPKSLNYWAFDVNACLIAAHRPLKKYLSEVIMVTFYYDEVFRLAT